MGQMPDQPVARISVHPHVVGRDLAEQARRLRCSPRDLCTALLVTVFQADLVDSILDGDCPEEIVAAAERRERLPVQRRKVRPLRGSMKAVFELLCRDAGEQSEVTLRHSDIARALGIEHSTATSALQKLASLGFIEQTVRGVKAKPGCYRLLRREEA